MSDDLHVRLARKQRMAALLIAGGGVFWVLAELIGSEYGWSPRARALPTMIAGAAFVWALVMIWQIWRARRDMEG
ncbi:DUF5337 domain-containing protein [Aquicoccus sp.]|uniref:DUF5337 domain-containing protein n=1 Tax=Aquicoccus sp. TaxID=2055851 RepID=UPI00356720AC